MGEGPNGAGWSPDGVVAVRGARLFDGHRFVDDPVVLVDGGRIAAVGARVPAGVPVVGLDGATLLPGLVDCHQHLVFDGAGTLEEQVAGRTDDELEVRARAAARRALFGGITTLRDLGDRGFVTLGLRQDPELPTILCAGPPITTIGGHCWFLGGECSGRDQLIAAVSDRIARGCDVVKIMVTGGHLTPAAPMWKSQFDLADLQTVVRHAHAAGLGVAAHCHGVRGIDDAIAAGVDTIEHCSFLDESMRAAPDGELIDRVAHSGIAVSATLGLTPGAVLPEEITELLPGVFDALSRVRAAGGQVVVGSDAGILPYKPHDVARYAIDDLAAIGMAPVEALRAMTSEAADAIGLPNKGRIAPGADADLLAVDGDPRADPRAMTRTVQVWRAGRAVLS